MSRFYKKLMLERIERNGMSHLVDEESLAMMDNLDGCEASRSCWERVVHDEPVMWVVGKDGEGAYVHEDDCR